MWPEQGQGSSSGKEEWLPAAREGPVVSEGKTSSSLWWCLRALAQVRTWFCSQALGVLFQYAVYLGRILEL